jgi:hypothetical protein
MRRDDEDTARTAVERYLCGIESPDRFSGYGWRTTLTLLSPLATAETDSRHSFKMIVCPACGSVREDGGVCISRHGGMTSFIFDTPATIMGNDNPLELQRHMNRRSLQISMLTLLNI